jgi:hypothetical protein
MYAHMVATTVNELHEFAASIGISKSSYHNGSKRPHYDITEEQRESAIKAGAVEVTSRDIVKMFK